MFGDRVPSVVDIDFGAAQSLADRLHAVADILAKADLFDDACRLAHHGFLVDLLHLDTAILESCHTEFVARNLAVDRPTVDPDRFVPQLDALGDRSLDHVAVHPNLAAADRALADDETFLDDLQHRPIAAFDRRGHGRGDRRRDGFSGRARCVDREGDGGFDRGGHSERCRRDQGSRLDRHRHDVAHSRHATVAHTGQDGRSGWHADRPAPTSRRCATTLPARRGRSIRGGREFPRLGRGDRLRRGRSASWCRGERPRRSVHDRRNLRTALRACPRSPSAGACRPGRADRMWRTRRERPPGKASHPCPERRCVSTTLPPRRRARDRRRTP